MSKPTDQDLRNQAMLNAVVTQREQALNAVAELQAQLHVTSRQLQEALATIQKLSSTQRGGGSGEDK